MPSLIDLVCKRKTKETLELIPNLTLDELNMKHSFKDKDKDEDFDCFTALHVAALFGLNDIVVSLIQRGVNVRARDKKKRTAMHYAAEACEGIESYDKLRTIQLLHFAESYLIYDTDNKGNTPLHLAALYGEFSWAAKLVRLGSIRTAKNNAGQMPIELVPAAQKDLFLDLLRPVETLLRKALRAIKNGPTDIKRKFLETAPDELIEPFVILDEPPRLAVWCFNQAREQEQENAQKQAKMEVRLDPAELTQDVAKLGLK